MTTAILPLLGVVVGAFLQYFFTRHLEYQKHHRALRSQAYTDYLKSVSEQAQLIVQRQSQEAREILSRTADAKCRICLYGSSEAIEAFADFERHGAAMGTDEQRAAFTKMVSIMRSDSGSSDEVEAEDLGLVLMGHGRTVKPTAGEK